MISREFPPAIKGGQGTVVYLLTRQLSALGHNVDLIIPKQSQKLPKIPSVSFYEVPTLGRNFITRSLSFYFSSQKIIRGLIPNNDIIYSHGTWISPTRKLPVVTHFHTSRYGEAKACWRTNKPIHALINWIFISLDQLMVKQSDTVIVLTQEMALDIQNHTRVKRAFEIIENGIDVKPVVKATSQRSVAKNSSIKILYYGRLDPRKRIDLLLRAVAASNLNAKVQITGEGPEEHRLRKLAKELDVRVDFTGFMPREDIFQAFANHDLVVLPSTYEGFPMTTLECTTAGIPIITSDACPDLGQKRFKRDDVVSLAEELKKFASGKASYLHNAKSLQKTIKRYALAVMTKKVSKVLVDCISKTKQSKK